MPDSITLMESHGEQQHLFLGCDAHRKYSVFVAMDEKGKSAPPIRVDHDRAKFRMFLRRLPPGTEVAVEVTGSWYWLMDELEAAGLVPHLAQPFAAKRMLGVGSKKTDSVDARALATLLRNGTLPETWIPSADWRDLRNLMRTRLALREYQTCLKNRIVAAMNRYGYLEIGEVERFPSPSHLASYAGLVPVVHASGGRIFQGPTSPRSNSSENG